MNLQSMDSDKTYYDGRVKLGYNLSTIFPSLEFILKNPKNRPESSSSFIKTYKINRYEKFIESVDDLKETVKYFDINKYKSIHKS